MSSEDLPGRRGREPLAVVPGVGLAVVLALALVLALVVVALVDWLAA